MKSKRNLLIIGANSTARHVYSFVKEYNLFNIIGFAVDSKYKTQDTFLDQPLYAIEQLENNIDKEKDLLFVAILWNRLNADRKNVYERLKKQGFKFANLISPTAIIRGTLLGDNCWVHDYSCILYGAKVESNVIIQPYCLIGEYANVTPHCFLGAKSTLADHCTIGEQCFVGINAVIFDDRIIGNKCIIGACTAAKRNMPDFTSLKTSAESLILSHYKADEVESKLMFDKNAL